MPTQRTDRAPGLALMILAGVLTACQANDYPQESAAFAVSVQRLAETGAPVWWMDSADVDADGAPDLLIAGHRGASGARIFHGASGQNTEGREAGQPSGYRVLGTERDRHGCALADIVGNPLPDVFCVSGADRGAGSNESELWRNIDGYRFEKVTPHGAEDPFARGRLARFMNLDGRHPPELVTTVWGPREDSHPNASMIWRWQQGRFRTVPTRFGDRWGGRCIAVFDHNNDGLDDLFACAEGRGAALFLNNGQGDFERSAIGGLLLRYSWWWDMALVRDASRDVVLVAFTAQVLKRQTIHIGELASGPGLSVRRKIPCGFEQETPHKGVFCARVLWHDFNADGASDLYVVRRTDRENTRAGSDVDDLILLGPSFETYLSVTRSDIGASTAAVSRGNAVARLTAGEDRPGSIDLIRLVDGNATSP